MRTPLAILNTSIVTNDGTYSLETIPAEQAIALVRNAEEIDSAVGHESTSHILTTILGMEIPMNRQVFQQKPGQVALVFKLNDRPPEGAILSLEELETIGFSFKLMTRLS